MGVRLPAIATAAVAGALFAAAPADALTCAQFKTAVETATNGAVITLDAGLTCTDTYALPHHAPPFSVTIQGAGAGATLDGTGKTSSIISGVVFSGDQIHATIRNLTFRNGTSTGSDGGAIGIGASDTAVTIDHDRFFGNKAPTGSGGAVRLQSSASGGALVVKNSVFGDGTAAGANTAAEEGALQVLSFDKGGSVAVTGNTFDGNSTPGGTGAASVAGVSTGASTTVAGNTFVGNVAHAEAGALRLAGHDVLLAGNSFTGNHVVSTASQPAFGGAVRANGFPIDTLTQIGNRFTANRITLGSGSNQDTGGGGEWVAGPQLVSRGDRFTRNSLPASPGTGEAEGGGLGIEGCQTNPPSTVPSRLENAVIAGNSGGAGGRGGGLYAGGCLQGPVALTVLDSTISGNATSGTGATAGLLGGPDDTLTLRNSVVAGNRGGPDLAGFGAGRTVTSSDACAPAVLPGAGNICSQPKLADAAHGNVHQTSLSPTINRGANAAVPPTLKTDFEGNKRILLGRVDMGADEFLDPFAGVKIASKTVTVKNGVATVRVLCPKIAVRSCTGSLRLVRPAGKGRKKLKVGHHGFKIAHGKTVGVPVKISSAGLAALAKTGSLTVRAKAAATDGAGAKRTSSRKLKLSS